MPSARSKFRKNRIPRYRQIFWHFPSWTFLDYERIAHEMLSCPAGLEALAREALAEDIYFLVLAMIVQAGGFDKTVVIECGPNGKITVGASADAPKKAGRKLTPEEAQKIRVGVSVSSGARSNAREGIVQLPEHALKNADEDDDGLVIFEKNVAKMLAMKNEKKK